MNIKLTEKALEELVKTGIKNLKVVLNGYG